MNLKLTSNYNELMATYDTLAKRLDLLEDDLRTLFSQVLFYRRAKCPRAVASLTSQMQQVQARRRQVRFQMIRVSLAIWLEDERIFVRSLSHKLLRILRLA